MVNGEVRLRYSGFIIFLTRLLSVGTGLAFSLMVTRTILPETFGVYENMSDVLSYFTLAAGLFPFWATRFVARNHAGSSLTAVIANLLVSLPSALVYLLMLPAILANFNVAIDYFAVYAVAGAQIIEIYLVNAFEAIIYAKRPQALGFGFLFFEFIKVAFGYVLIIRLELGLLGAVASVISAILIQLVYYLKLVLPELREEMKWAYVKEWLKGSLLNLYGITGQRLASSIMLLLFVYGGQSARAFYGAANRVASVVVYSSLLGYALYPRLLSENKPQDVDTSFRLVLMFTMPMTAGAIILAGSYLTILNVAYSVATPVLVLLALDALCQNLSSIFVTVVTGAEKFDVEAKINYKDMIQSKLFLLLSLPFAQAAAALPLAYFVLNSVTGNAVDAAAYIAAIALAVDAGLVIVRYVIAKRSLGFTVSWAHASKYAGATALMALFLYIIPQPTRLSTTVGVTLLGGCLYFLVLSVVDIETKNMIKSVFKELLRKRGILRVPRKK
jgi:hypothetical protein